ncbi:phosphoribosyltransferase [Sulfurovum sp. NBC37-1]|uniref:phosphoribosyltransferase n=1 Tax=Sulfurovum sp. (strain NBC37-1) TaxID=387093 RepID=UPI0001587AD7|nr:phosphoribosyltransferase family protein [Sulfurovum sp. NBC37-1]BAF72456.1 xanthine phosphoribosyltransferase [Sulfurovum sp. NBC37-1]
MVYYGYEQFVEDVKKLVRLTAEYNPDTIIAIARGGWTLGHAYASATDNRQLMSINSILYEGDQKGKQCKVFNIPELDKAKKVLLMDDIVDSGETMKEVLNHLKNKFPHIEFRIASIYYKKTAVIQPDYVLYKTDEWIEFFWEKDYLSD